MPNIKFSQFTTQTDPANVQFVVGYNGTTNVKIAPGDIGGGGATSLNGLTDCLVDTASLYVGEVPAGLSGNPQSNTVLGIDAGDSLTSAAGNTLLGNQSGKTLTVGAYNTLIGMRAGGLGYSTVSNVVAIGASAGRDTNSGNNSVLIGNNAGVSNTGTSAIAIGLESGRVNSATGTISIGYQTGFSNTSGVQIILTIGYQSWIYKHSKLGNSRTIIGYSSR